MLQGVKDRQHRAFTPQMLGDDRRSPRFAPWFE
jgi:hypothetical protein